MFLCVCAKERERENVVEREMCFKRVRWGMREKERERER